MSVDLSKKSIIVVDNGIFAEFASVLARSFGEVYYHCASANAYRKMTKGLVGTGIEGLIVLEDDPFELPPSTFDAWVFPDVGFGHFQEELRDRGARVWGSGLGELMENDRVGMKVAMKKAGLPVGKYTVVRGLDKLRVFLEENEGVYVKVSKWRGSFESFRSLRYELVKSRLDKIERDLGPLAQITEFIVEEALPDRVEIGVDCWTVDGKYPQKYLRGIEVKDKGYVGAFADSDTLPKPLQTVNKALAPMFKRYGYRGAFSTEVRSSGPDDAYLIDMTCRLPSPPSESYGELYTNLAEIVWEGAGGEMVEPKPLAKCAAQLVINSSWTNENWQEVFFPPKIRQFVKLIFPMRIDGRYYVSPQHEGLDSIGGVVGFGDTPEAAGKQALEHAAQVEGPGIDFARDAIDDAIKALDEADKLGIKML